MVKRELNNFELLSLAKYFNDEKNIINNSELNIKTLWNIRKNLKMIEPIIEVYNKEEARINDKYSDDKHSFEVEDDGKKVRKLYDKYIEQYNKEKVELLSQKSEFNFNEIVLEDFGNICATMNDLNMLSYFIDDNK